MVGGSIVEFFGEHESYHCGYCKNSNTNCSTGMWGHCLTPQVYQDLIDRGWRRSGKHCYKPTMDRTCCPQYTIRCEALSFKLSKSQKKILKRMHKFLATGQIPVKTKDDTTSANDVEDRSTDGLSCALNVPVPRKSSFDENLDISLEANADNVPCSHDKTDSEQNCNESSPAPSTSHNRSGIMAKDFKSTPKERGMNPSRHLCRKAKDVRRERRLQKLMKAGISPDEVTLPSKKQKCAEKSLEDFLSEPFSAPPVHRLELRLVSTVSDDFQSTVIDSHMVYSHYQQTIHKEAEEECSMDTFEDFLVDSPFEMSKQSSDGELGFGSYHQQYWLDDEIIAVGVIDILPYCVSSVYLYYDPKYSFLSLGTYAALREIALTRELHVKYPDLIYYYMGFYVHTCPKMRYKKAYSPSFLLCPETYTFYPIERCLPKLEVSKYHRFEEDLGKGDADGIVHLNEVMILYQRQAMTYEVYRCWNRRAKDEQEVKLYAAYVGRKCYPEILLYRK